MQCLEELLRRTDRHLSAAKDSSPGSHCLPQFHR